jgi:hypothetical protein
MPKVRIITAAARRARDGWVEMRRQQKADECARIVPAAI